MEDKMAITHYLVIPRLKVQNANAISSPLTHGFPSITAFMGMMWALERRICQIKGDQACPIFLKVGVICHDYQEQTYRNGYREYFTPTRNPLESNGSTAPINEEGRIHLTISLVFALQHHEWQSLNSEQLAPLAKEIADILAQMRIAGGSIIPSLSDYKSQYDPLEPAILMREKDEEEAVLLKRIIFGLGRGFALVEREDVLDRRLEALRKTNPEANRLDAFLSLAAVNYAYDDKTKTWQNDRSGAGWLVPIPVGYGLLEDGLRPVDSVLNARDRTVEFGVVESLFSFGEWRNIYRFSSPAELLWEVDNDPQKNVYRCRNHYARSLMEEDPENI